MMNTAPPDSKLIKAYHTGFVLALLLLFLYVMVMSSRSEGLGKLQKDFVQKHTLIENFNHLRIKLGDRVFNNVLVGEDGWMEYTDDLNLDDYQNAIPFSARSLESVAATIQSCHQFAQDHDMVFLIVVSPNKASIYPDKVPDQIRTLSDVSRLDQLNTYLRERDIPEVLDLRPALRNARQQQEVYYKLGTHWNPYGAYVAYEKIINVLSQSYPELEPYPAKFFRFRTFYSNGESNNSDGNFRVGDKRTAELIQLSYLDVEPTLFPTREMDGLVYEVDFPFPQIIPGYHKISWIPDSNLPSLLIYHDSFGRRELNEFLVWNFSKIFYVHRDSASVFLNRPTIEQFSPDIFVYEVVERSLHQIQDQLSGCAQE